MRPIEFYQQAETYFDSNEGSEAAYRGIIHLCYYAVFHECARLMGVPTHGTWDRATHADIKDKLRGHTSEHVTIYRANRMYKGLLALRVKSDYNISQIINKEDARDALMKAGFILLGI